MPNIQRDIFPQKGSVSVAKPQFALPVIDQTASTLTTTTLTAGTDFTVPAGAAAASVTIKLKFAPILGQYGRTGSYGNTSLSFGGALATTLTTEVPFRADANELGGTIAVIRDLAALNNGEYMVDYETGIIYGKRADNGTTGTCTITYWLKSAATSGSSDITSVIPGTGATNLGKAEDAPHASGDVGVAMFAKRTDTAANSAGADGDYSTVNNDSLGHLWNREGYAPLYENNSLQRAMTLQGVSYTNISASALIKTGSGYLAGFIVNSASAGATIKLWDNTSAATTVLLNTITYTAAANQGGDNKNLASPIAFGTGLYCTITGTMDVTLFWI